VLGIMERDGKTAIDKLNMGNAVVYYLCVVLTINFVYFCYRIYVQVYRKLWLPFTDTKLFMENFP
jgi:hypothetical protein